jgi:hypothetical protein
MYTTPYLERDGKSALTGCWGHLSRSPTRDQVNTQAARSLACFLFLCELRVCCDLTCRLATASSIQRVVSGLSTWAYTCS